VHEAKEGWEDVRKDFVAILSSLTACRAGRRRASQKKSRLFAALEEH
jgi:predicted site-specific integrase-resolvase